MSARRDTAAAPTLVRQPGPRGLVAKAMVALWLVHALLGLVAVAQLTYHAAQLLAVPASARTGVDGIEILATFFAIAVAAVFTAFMARLALFALRLPARPAAERGALLRFAIGVAAFQLLPALVVHGSEMDDRNPAGPLLRCLGGECLLRPQLGFMFAEIVVALASIAWLLALRRIAAAP